MQRVRLRRLQNGNGLDEDGEYAFIRARINRFRLCFSQQWELQGARGSWPEGLVAPFVCIMDVFHVYVEGCHELDWLMQWL